MQAFNPFLDKAIELAAQWHEATYRKSCWREAAFDLREGDTLRVPTMAHLTSVALIVQRAGWEDPVVAAAFLHDALEDANRYGDAFRYEQLRDAMGEEVAGLVRSVSEKKYDANGVFRSWRDRKTDYIAQVSQSALGAVAISLADKIHNVWSMNEALASGINIFEPAEGRKALSAGPEAQVWFHRAILNATRDADDPRLEALRTRLFDEVGRLSDRFDAGTEAGV